MARLTLYQATDMLNQRTFFGEVSLATPTRLLIESDTQYASYEGAFTYSGDRVFGRLTAFSMGNGPPQVYATGLNLDAQVVQQLVERDQLQTLFSLALVGNDTVFGSTSTDVITAGAGNDLIYPGGGRDTVYGGTGVDTVYRYDASSSVTLSRGSDGGITITPRTTSADAIDAVYEVERIRFDNVSLAFDAEAAQIYRLYGAAFDRVPDRGGVGFWIAQRDAGVSLDAAANSFINSAEFRILYGSASNAQFVNLVYRNVLDRPPDAAGASYWVGQLDAGVSRASMMIGFSESAENQLAVAGAIANGVAYTPFIA